MSDDCLGARFEILIDGKTQSCRDSSPLWGLQRSSRARILIARLR
jgi:hypothetical protein